MNGQDEQKLINIGIFIIIILVLLIFIRTILILPSISSDDICRFEYGEYWVYENTYIFGKTCVEIDYVSLEIINRTQQNLTWREATDKYCNSPGFWEFSEWENECKDG